MITGSSFSFTQPHWYHPATVHHLRHLRSHARVLAEQLSAISRVRELAQKYDSRSSFAPRDIVARAIDSEMKPKWRRPCIPRGRIKTRRKHATISRTYTQRLSLGSISSQKITYPGLAAHYLRGGIKSGHQW